ncbi:MAG: OmpA family protein [Terriglobia bacterium]
MGNRLRLLELCLLLGVIVLAGACHKRIPAAAIPAATPSAAPPPPPGPPTCDLTAAPASVTMGQSVTLSWSTNNATTLDLKPGLGSQQAEGSTSVTPSESTTYIMSLTGAGGTGECRARVTVTPATPPSASVQESNLGAAGAGAAGAAGSQMEDAFFDYNKSDVTASAQTALTHDADYLKSHPDVKVRIGGYCDQRGSEEYNLGLGQRRADAAKQFIVNLGIPPDNIATVSYGKDRPFCTETTDACYQQNRRAHVVLINGNQ